MYRNENVLAFRDLNPQAPTHVLIVPTLHVKNVGELAKVSAVMAAALLAAAAQIANDEGLDGYRTLFNTGESAGQSVFHAHLHLLGGRTLHWPPG